MIVRFVQDGKAIDYRPTDFVAAGDIVVMGTLIGIARLDIGANTLGSLAVVGVFDAPKAKESIVAGAVVYWDETNSKVTTTATGNSYLGKAVFDADVSDESVRFLLNTPYTTRVTE